MLFFIVQHLTLFQSSSVLFWHELIIPHRENISTEPWNNQLGAGLYLLSYALMFTKTIHPRLKTVSFALKTVFIHLSERKTHDGKAWERLRGRSIHFLQFLSFGSFSSQRKVDCDKHKSIKSTKDCLFMKYVATMNSWEWKDFLTCWRGKFSRFPIKPTCWDKDGRPSSSAESFVLLIVLVSGPAGRLRPRPRPRWIAATSCAPSRRKWPSVGVWCSGWRRQTGHR